MRIFNFFPYWRSFFSPVLPLHKNNRWHKQNRLNWLAGESNRSAKFSGAFCWIKIGTCRRRSTKCSRYCHLKASPIVDSISKAFNARISRISIKYRNPANSPDTLDLTIINAYARQLAEGQALQPHLEYSGNNVIFYSPIVIQNPMCLLCHGEPGRTIDQANYDFIRSKYPDDLATGYQLGDLRGVWKVQFLSFNQWPMTDDLNVIHVPEAHRFEVPLPGEPAVLIYEVRADICCCFILRSLLHLKEGELLEGWPERHWNMRRRMGLKSSHSVLSPPVYWAAPGIQRTAGIKIIFERL